MPTVAKQGDPFGIQSLPGPVKSLVDLVYSQSPDVSDLGPTAIVGMAARPMNQAVKKLLSLLKQSPPTKNPDILFSLEKSVGAKIPHPETIQVPEGMSLGNTSPFSARSPKMRERYAQQRVFDASQKKTVSTPKEGTHR